LVSIIIAARDEAATMGPALRSVLALEYAPLEIIVVNDRSTDGTGAIVEELTRQDLRLRLMEVKKLPPGWLGKNHALQLGAAQASGEFLLFTDADVVFEKSVLTRAISRMGKKSLDHLSLVFEVPAIDGLLGMLMLEVASALFFVMKPWKAVEPSSPYFMGVGAFNLVRASVYRACGGHEAIRLCPIDDIMLGKLLKTKGFRQECLFGHGFVKVKWYESVHGMIQGMMKNTFAGFDYSLVRAAVVVVVGALLGVWPLAALFLLQGPAFFLNGVLVVSRLIFFGRAAHTLSMQPFHALWSLVTPCIGIYVGVKASWLTLANGGITWRGTHYPLRDLKEGTLR